MRVAPGATFAATAEGFDTGLAGTLGVRIEETDGTTHTARTTAGIVEVEAGSGVYAKADLVAPATRGTYVLLWDDGTTFAAEELRIGYGIATADGDDLITVDELAAYLSPQSPPDLSEDLLAAMAVAGACARIRRHAEQELDYVADDTATFRASNDSRVILPELPVVAVDEVRVDGEVETDWELRSDGVVERVVSASDVVYGMPTSRWSGLIEVDYSHGYSTIPPELKLLAATLAARAYQQGIARQESTGSTAVTYSVAAALDLSSGEESLLEKFRHPRAPRVLATGSG